MQKCTPTSVHLKHFVNSGQSNFLGVEFLLLQNASVHFFDQATAFKLVDSHQYMIMKFITEYCPSKNSVVQVYALYCCMALFIGFHGNRIYLL